MEYITAKEFSLKWKIKETKVTRLCRNGQIENAIKKDGIWLIPKTAKMPVDGRVTKAKSVIDSLKTLPLPIGETEYKNVVKNYYYVDKTLLIKELLDKLPKVSLFTRPRRFGKTLTMSMLKTFFEISDEDNTIYFKNFNIWNYPSYKHELGKYPVFFVSFKDIKRTSWNLCFNALRKVISYECRRYLNLLESDKLDSFEKDYFKNLLDNKTTEEDLQDAFLIISKMLKKHYNSPAIIIIDEYDTPIQEGYTNGYYNEVITFMRNLLSAAYKDNDNLKFGFLTGILQVGKESIFSGLNNLSTHSIVDRNFGEYFGFTNEDIIEILNYYNKLDKYDEIKKWYNGYKIGDANIFNPWSVINYCYNNFNSGTYWISTGENSIIRQIVKESDDSTKEELCRLLQGEEINTYIKNSVVYPNIKTDSSTIYSFLLITGYLTLVKSDNSNGLTSIRIPNKEISIVYKQEILEATSSYLPQSSAIALQQAMYSLDFIKLEECISSLLLKTISSFDYSQEGFYQGLSIGLCAILNDKYNISSNIETGYGRCDIQLLPIDNRLSGFIIEVKAVKELNGNIEDKLLKISKDAIEQINDKKYYDKILSANVKRICKIGIAFHKKYVKLTSVIEEIK